MSCGVSQFSSELVDRIRLQGGVYEVSPSCTVLLPKALGFCTGVNRAVTTLNDVVKEPDGGRPVWLLGAMIHNPAVNEAFAKAGVQISVSADEVFDNPQSERLKAFLNNMKN